MRVRMLPSPRHAGGGEVEFTFTGPANGAAEFKETGEAVHTIRGWFGKMLGRSDEGGSAREMVTVYTDIEAPTPALFSDVTAYSGLGAGRQLTLQPAAHGSLAASDSFPEAADKGQVNTRTYEENGARSFTGALQGGEGTFRCTGSTCTVTADDEGALTFEGAWTFAFDEEAMVDEADEDYLHFGYWLKTIKEEDGDTYLFQTFWGGEEPFLETGARISGLEGAAIYAGPAAGVYVRKTLKADGRINTATSGHFTANTELTATFGQTAEESIAPSDLFSIHGTVKDFMDGGKSLHGWTVNLNKATFADRVGTQTSNHESNFAATTAGSETAAKGAWRGGFFGNPAVPGADTYPGSVSGEFNANFANGHVSGAFGAVKPKRVLTGI